MTAGPFHDPEKRDENADPVWRLLLRSPLPRVPDGWFAARTIARCRSVEIAAQEHRSRFAVVCRWLTGAGLAAVVAIFLVERMSLSVPATTTGQRNVQEAFEILATMQPETDSSSPSSWQDSDL